MKISLKDKLELTYEDTVVILPMSEILSSSRGHHSIYRRGVYKSLTGIKLIKDKNE